MRHRLFVHGYAALSYLMEVAPWNFPYDPVGEVDGVSLFDCGVWHDEDLFIDTRSMTISAADCVYLLRSSDSYPVWED